MEPLTDESTVTAVSAMTSEDVDAFLRKLKADQVRFPNNAKKVANGLFKPLARLHNFLYMAEYNEDNLGTEDVKTEEAF